MCGSRFWKLFILIIHLNLNLSSAVIYRLNSSEYDKMPPVFTTDSYDKCMEDVDAVYCLVELALVSDTPNQLLETMREYSEHTPTHFNHTLIRHGICLNACKYAQNKTWDRRNILEACFNDTYWQKYGFKTKLQENFRCTDTRNVEKYKTADIIFLVVLVVILLLNIIGSFCDVQFTASKGLGMRFLKLFSVSRNWKKLVAPGCEGPEPRLKMLAGIAGSKVITTILVIIAHNLICIAFYVDNPVIVENYFSSPVAHLFLNGTIIVQTFFIITGFLLVYNLLLFSEKRQVNWSMLPKGIFLRWIRLTPPYALILFFTATCLRFLGSGPGWDIAVLDEVNDCRQYWWQHLLYINNYNDVSQCLLQTWYLAADTQLYCLGLVVFIICKSCTFRKVVLSVLLIVGLIVPPLQTYLQDLDGAVVVSPENIINFFRDNPTFNKLYKTTHPNIFPYALGLTAGYLVYYLQEINFDVQKYKKYRLISWCLLPIGILVVWSGFFLYSEGPRPSLSLRVAHAAVMKPAYAVLIFLGLLMLMFKYLKAANFFLESQVWTVLGRLSYCSYLVHLTLLRLMVGTLTVQMHITLLFLFQQALFLTFSSFAVALPLWLLVEQPFGQIVKVLL